MMIIEHVEIPKNLVDAEELSLELRDAEVELNNRGFHQAANIMAMAADAVEYQIDLFKKGIMVEAKP